MYQKLEECPSCKHTLFTNYLICNDYSVSQESFALVQCSRCKLVFTNPRPDEKRIIEYYKSDNYISHSNKSNNLINTVYRISRYFTLRTKYHLIKKYVKTGSILDFGSGTGHFIEYMSDKGWNATGYEPNTLPPTNSQVTYLDNFTKINSDSKYEIITAWHVIEHVHELQKTIKQLRKSLGKNGYLIIAVPNLNSYDAKHYKQHWAAYDTPRHLYHFSQKSFNTLISNLKMKIISTHPMKLDAYYVSWLSEKYLGTNNLFKAIITGFQSNKAASKTGEYSSLIYILKA